MTEEAAIVVNSIDGYKTTDDGKYVLIKTDQPIPLGISVDALPQLFQATVDGMGNAKKATGSNERFVVDCQWWEIGVEQNAPNLILSLTVQGGGRLDFRLPLTQAPHIRDVLVSITGQGPTSAPDGVTKQ
ncbi:MAG: hypothetical protein P4L92_07230 [Rudaea sp.]|nr:hypothetical protein [Rudaea sp.]